VSGSSSPWIERLKRFSSREAIRAAARSEGTAFVPDSAESITLATKRFRKALESFYCPTEQSLDILEKLIGEALAHAISRYPSISHFRGTIYGSESKKEKGAESDVQTIHLGTIIAITGLAGVGKSAISDALERVLSDEKIRVCLDLTVSHPVRILNRANVLSDKGVWSILAGLASDQSSELSRSPRFRYERDPDGRKRSAKRFAYSAGICLNLIDELQFLTRSTGAIIRATDAVFMSSTIGVPTVYLMNFSFGRKIKKRHHEERDRLLGTILYLLPDEPDSPDWINYLREITRIAGSVLEVDLLERQKDFYLKSAGLPRQIHHLLTLAYEHALKERGPTARITWQDILNAYGSRDFAVAREDIELINKQAIERKMQRGRADLWCPFDESVNYRKSVVTLIETHSVSSEFANLVAQSLTPAQRDVVKRLRTKSAAARTGGKVQPIGARKVDVDTMIKNAAELGPPSRG
jgi:energy-coupling factor transporter ATP-binding protein EcfA2